MIGFGLLIPILKLLIGLVALILIFNHIPRNHSGIAIPGSGRRILLLLLAAFAALCCSSVALSVGNGWLSLSIPVGAVSLFAAFTYGKLQLQSFKVASRVVLERSEQLDTDLESFRRQHNAIFSNQAGA